MSEQDKEEFLLYLAACTDNQVLGVLEKERAAGRGEFVELAKEEATKRGLI